MVFSSSFWFYYEIPQIHVPVLKADRLDDAWVICCREAC